jgi:hypothetical protein
MSPDQMTAWLTSYRPYNATNEPEKSTKGSQTVREALEAVNDSVGNESAALVVAARNAAKSHQPVGRAASLTVGALKGQAARLQVSRTALRAMQAQRAGQVAAGVFRILGCRRDARRKDEGRRKKDEGRKTRDEGRRQVGRCQAWRDAL